MTDMGPRIVFKETESVVIQAGLMLAGKKWPQGITVSGSVRFRAAVVRMAVEMGVERSISNPELGDAIADAVSRRRRLSAGRIAQGYLEKRGEELSIKEAGADEKPKVGLPVLEMKISKSIGSQPTLSKRQSDAIDYVDARARVKGNTREEEEEARLMRIRGADSFKAPALSCGQAYLRLAFDFLSSKSSQTPDVKAWRAFDKSLVSSSLYEQFSIAEISTALTSLSPAAIVGVEAMRARLVLAADARPVIETYGQDVTRKISRVSEAVVRPS